MQLEGADLRHLRLGQREVVRRLYVAVRDAHWNTVPPEIADLRVQAGPGTFRVEFTCRHRLDKINFVWQGTITGSAEGRVAYTMRGHAESTFERARIGICVLHPIDTCAGAPFRVTHPDGSEEEGVLPRLIAPHQPVLDIVELAHSVGSDGWVRLQFEGDVFEMEDQRNWTDASFKTYSTPLRLPIPVRVPPRHAHQPDCHRSRESFARLGGAPTPRRNAACRWAGSRAAAARDRARPWAGLAFARGYSAIAGAEAGPCPGRPAARG